MTTVKGKLGLALTMLVATAIIYTNCSGEIFSGPNPVGIKDTVSGNPLQPMQVAQQFARSMCKVISSCAPSSSPVSEESCYSQIQSTTNVVPLLGVSSQTYPTLGALITANLDNSVSGDVAATTTAIQQMQAESCNSSAVQSIFTAGKINYANAAAIVPVSSWQIFAPLATWINVTPANADLTDSLSCGNYGAETVQSDPVNPSNLYAQFHCQGIWKSTDYGITWTGPINIGQNGAAVSDCAGGVTVAPGNPGSAPTIYETCLRGSGVGFWKSIDGGVNWTSYLVAPSGGAQDYGPVAIDPYNQNHLLMVEQVSNYFVESVDGGQTWANINLASGMVQNGAARGSVFFINTGSASTTHSTWLWIAQVAGGLTGTWRTTNSGVSWVQVDTNEHPTGSSQIYQPDTSGVVYMAGLYSAFGWGVLRSTDYGQTWAHVGQATSESLVFGTSKNIYSMLGGPIGVGASTNTDFEIGTQPGTGTWITPATPPLFTQGPGQVSIVNDGTHNILMGAMWNGGLWRYVEP